MNNKEGPEWKVWEQPQESPGRSLLALRAGEAAKRQGTEAFDAFLLTLMKARHEQREDISDRQVILEVARSAGLDVGRLQEDMVDQGILRDIGESHTRAVGEYGVFGVPTYIFADKGVAFLKMFTPPDEEAVPAFEMLRNLVGRSLYVGEIKRPQPPWPKGIHSRRGHGGDVATVAK